MEEPPRFPIVRVRQIVCDTNPDDTYRIVAWYDLYASTDMLEADRPLYGQRTVSTTADAMSFIESRVWDAIAEREGFELSETRPVVRAPRPDPRVTRA